MNIFKKTMKTIIVVLLYTSGFLLGAITHEADMSRNYEKYGDAKAWFFDIKK